MKNKDLVTTRTETKNRYFNILGEECSDKEHAYASSKSYLISKGISMINIVLTNYQKELITSVILDLEEHDILHINWDKINKD